MSYPNLASKCTGSKLVLLAAFLALLVSAAQPAQAQYTQSVPYTFTGGSDGSDPASGLVSDSKGNLYGTTAKGGDTTSPNCAPLGGCGVVFELSPPSGGTGPWTETVLLTFHDGSEGGYPYAGVIFDSLGSNLYGTTAGGGPKPGYGVVFELSPPSGGTGPWTETVLYNFTGGNDGEAPLAGVVFDSAGNLYGTAFGGAKGYGVAFELSPPSGGTGPWTENLLYTFTGTGDGAYPYAGLIFDAQGNLYGTTSNGGNLAGSNCKITRGCGVVFELSPPSGGTFPWSETTPYIFNGGSDGGFPYAGVIFDSKGKNLYGTTVQGGNLNGANCSGSGGCGVVFELTPPSGGSGPWTETVPYTFTGGSDGGAPAAGLIFDSKGNLYSSASSGGNLSGSNCSGIGGCGVVFELTPPSGGTGPWTETVLYTFTGGSDGSAPAAGLIFDFKGDIFSTASTGGDLSGSNCSGLGGCGVVFELSPPVGAALLLSPNSLNFGNLLVNTTSAAKKVTATNNGVATLNFNSITVSGDFAISANTCGATLAVGASCKVNVTFTPLQLGPLTGTLTFVDNAGNSPQTVPLTGTGVGPALLSPSSATYGKQKVGTTSRAKTFTLTNYQTVTLSNISISTTGDFAVSATTCGATLAAKKSCTISVTFTPTAKGTGTGQLSVSDNATNSPQTSSLMGTGT